jgi:hypothetical protein
MLGQLAKHEGRHAVQLGQAIVAPQTVTDRPSPQAPRHWVKVPLAGTATHAPA